MRKDRKDRKNIKDGKFFGGVKVTYEITGLNQDRLLLELKKRDFTLYEVKKLSNRVMLISVNLRESENFFAITKNLCYNIKKKGLLGKGLPVYKLAKNFGLVLGALVFLALSIISNDYIFELSFSGSGSVCAKQVTEYLESRGVVKYARFSSLSLERLEDEILADTPSLTFVSARKNGNTLELYLTLKTSKVELISGNALEICATEDGVVEQIKIYRGTALVSVGERVSAGQALVEGFVTIKEQRVETGALAQITLLSERVFEYRLTGAGKKDVALALAGEEFPEKEIVDSVVTVREVSGRAGEFIYTVSATYRTVIRE